MLKICSIFQLEGYASGLSCTTNKIERLQGVQSDPHLATQCYRFMLLLIL